MTTALTWEKKGSYQHNAYDRTGELVYTVKNKWALGWYYITNEWDGYEVGQSGNSWGGIKKAEKDWKERSPN